jgi:hypothetical protein
MIGRLVYFHTAASGERVGLVVDQQPRTGLFGIVYEATAGSYRAVRTDRVVVAAYPSESSRRRAVRIWIQRALSRESNASTKIKTQIRGVRP